MRTRGGRPTYISPPITSGQPPTVSPVMQRVEMRDAGGNSIALLEVDLAEATPNDVLAHLATEQLVCTRDPQGAALIMWLRHPGDGQRTARRSLSIRARHRG